MTSDPILEAFDRRRRRDPESAMVVSRRRRASAAEVERLARAAFARLESGGVASGDVVATAAANGPGFLAALLAVRRAGAAALLLDPSTPPAETRRTTSGLGAAAILGCRRRWPQGEDDFTLEAAANGRRRKASMASDVAVIKLTSGSTGRPRGIVTPSAALVADDRALAETMGLSDDERILAAIPMSHSYGLSSVAMPALMRRSVLVLPESPSPLEPLAAARAADVTFLPTVPAYLQALVRMSSPPPLPDSLRLVISAGAPLQPQTATRFRRRYGRGVHVFYGASECGGIAFDRAGDAGERGSLGTPVDGVRITLDPVSEGGAESGEPRGTVTVESPAVARGYLPDTDPGLAGGRFRTRDLGSFRGGELFLEGRLDDLVNVRGKKVDPREVETVVRRLPGVDDVAILGVAPAGGGEAIVRCFVACRRGEVAREEVQAWCRRHLAEHKVPRSVVLLDQLPRNERGKLDRPALLALEPGDATTRPAGRSRAVAGHG